MPAKYWMEVKDGIAYNKVWSPDGIADVQDNWVEVPEDSGRIRFYTTSRLSIYK